MNDKQAVKMIFRNPCTSEIRENCAEKVQISLKKNNQPKRKEALDQLCSSVSFFPPQWVL